MIPDFHEGLRWLQRLGLLLDAWVFQPQLESLSRLATTFPDLQFVMATPIGWGPPANRREDLFLDWKRGIKKLASCPNVVVKLGGFAMPVTGYGWHMRPLPPSSKELAEATRDWYLHVIDCLQPGSNATTGNWISERGPARTRPRCLLPES